jgi:hypothetical protein
MFGNVSFFLSYLDQNDSFQSEGTEPLMRKIVGSLEENTCRVHVRNLPNTAESQGW